MRIYFDGSARPSERGKLRTCIVAIRDEIAHVQDFPAGTGSAMDAEWAALMHAARYAIQHNIQEIEFVGDSLSVIESVERDLSKNMCMNDHRQKFLELIGDRPFKLDHVLRHINLAGRYLEEGNSQSFKCGLSLLEGASKVVADNEPL